MKDDLELIPSHLRVTCKLGDLARMVDKECNLTCSYRKGHGDEFSHYKELFHPGKRWLPIVRVLGGNRQDGSFEAALPIYDQHEDIVAFLTKELENSENILQDSLFLSLLSCIPVFLLFSRLCGSLFCSCVVYFFIFCHASVLRHFCAFHRILVYPRVRIRGAP